MMKPPLSRGPVPGLIALVTMFQPLAPQLAAETPSDHRAIASSQPRPASKDQEQRGRALQSLLDDLLVAHTDVPGIALYVHAPRLNIEWSGAAGRGERGVERPLRPDHTFRVASNTKTFVAAAILRLVEEGTLNLDGSISRYLSAASVAELERGGYRPAEITVRQLLTHTSGLGDIYDSAEFMRIYDTNPQRRWSREEQLTHAVDSGPPRGQPGTIFNYVDTGYILLGEIIERTTDRPLGGALRQLLGYDALGLTSTWLETLEAEPRGAAPRAHQYDGDRDAYEDDPSADLYGGGGLVSTVGDLGRFMRGLFTGRIFDRPATLEVMLTTIPVETVGPPYDGIPQEAGHYRMGVSVRQREGYTVYSHGGYWGTLAAYVPELDLALGVSMTQQKDHYGRVDQLVGQILTLTGGWDAGERQADRR